MMRGIMARLGDIFGIGSNKQHKPFSPIVLPGVGRVTTQEEYETQVQRIVERDARLRRMGYDMDVTARRTRTHDGVK